MLHEEVVSRLRHMLIEGEIPPGSRVPERELCATLKISRTPLREALKVLAADGLVVLLPNRGARVAPISLHGIRAFFEALDLAQRAMTRLAAERHTPQDLTRIEDECRRFERAAQRHDIEAMAAANFDFHMAIAAAASNAYLAQAYELLLFQGLRLSRISLAYGDDRPLRKRANADRLSRIADIVDQHRAMVRAIRARDAAEAEALAAAHVEVFRRRVFKFQSENLVADVKIAATA